jgi:hypothetical protein
MHAWTDSVTRVLAKAEELNMKVLTPKIGQPMILDGNSFSSESWWNF